MPKDNLATTGQESFALPAQEEKEPVVLNIEEDSADLIKLEKRKGAKTVFTGNPLLDWYHYLNRFFVEHSGVKAIAKATFFHLLSVMINSGVPMVKALRSLAMQTENSPRLQLIIEKIANDIEEGASLSGAFLMFDDVFSEQEIGMIQSGEASGQLAQILDRLAIDAEKVCAIKSKIKSAMMYPIVLLVLLIGVIVGMMIYVVPKLTQLFESTQAELPMLTKVVIKISDFFVNQKVALLVGTLGFVLFILMFRKTDIGRYFFDLLKIRLPIFGKLFKKAYLARFARSISNLMDSRISIVKTLEITAQSVGNEVYRKKLLLSREDIKQGIPLAESITESDLFPPMLINMIDVGEKTAQLDEIMGKVAVFYEGEVDTAVNGISKIIEPVVLIVIGGTVGLIIAAIMLPIMKLSTVVGNF